jgi:hypothetical protein
MPKVLPSLGDPILRAHVLREATNGCTRFGDRTTPVQPRGDKPKSTTAMV